MSNIIECRDLTKKYGENTALNKINLSLCGGKIYGLLGPNGSGKTTLIKLICSLISPTEGDINVCGYGVGVESKKRISYLSDCMALPESMKVCDIIKYYGEFFEDFDKSKAEKMIEDLGVEAGERIKHLSKGNKEKVQLILTMSRNAQAYLLDEPMGGVDPVTRDYILNTIISNYNENALVLISTHLISDVEKVLDEVIFLKDGNIVLFDSVDNLREKEGKSVDEIFREVFK